MTRFEAIKSATYKRSYITTASAAAPRRDSIGTTASFGAPGYCRDLNIAPNGSLNSKITGNVSNIAKPPDAMFKRIEQSNFSGFFLTPKMQLSTADIAITEITAGVIPLIKKDITAADTPSIRIIVIQYQVRSAAARGTGSYPSILSGVSTSSGTPVSAGTSSHSGASVSTEYFVIFSSLITF